MNAQTTIRAPWERYRPALDALKPGCSDEEARYRCGIMMARDQAQQRLDWDPCGTMRAVWLTASEAALKPMPIDHLRDTWGALGRMFLAARRLNEISDDIGGGADARG